MSTSDADTSVELQTTPERAPFAKNEEGMHLHRERDYEGAVSAFSEAIALYPGFVGAYRSRAEAYRKLGREEEAEADLDVVASRTPPARNRGDTAEVYEVRDQRWGSSSEDVVGSGRYILSFLMAGLVGLAIQYALRKKGWTATWINAVIFVVGVSVIAATG